MAVSFPNHIQTISEVHASLLRVFIEQCNSLSMKVPTLVQIAKVKNVCSPTPILCMIICLME